MSSAPIEFWHHCPICKTSQRLEPVSAPREDGVASHCVGCGNGFGLWLDGGTVDLELVRENLDLGDDNRYEIFLQQ